MAKAKSSDRDDRLHGSFEEAFEELQQLVQSIESGKLTLDESIERFEKGVKLAAYCRKRLDEAEARIRKLTEEGGLEALDSEEDS